VCIFDSLVFYSQPYLVNGIFGAGFVTHVPSSLYPVLSCSFNSRFMSCQVVTSSYSGMDMLFVERTLT